MLDFGPSNALNEKCPATFLVRNVMENTFRTCLRHLRSIWGGPKCFLTHHKFLKKCHIFMLLDDDFGPKLVGNERFRTDRFGFKKFMVKAIRLQFTMSPYLPLF